MCGTMLFGCLLFLGDGKGLCSYLYIISFARLGQTGIGGQGVGKISGFTEGHVGFFTNLLMLSMIRPMMAATNPSQGVAVTVRWKATLFQWQHSSHAMSPDL